MSGGGDDPPVDGRDMPPKDLPVERQAAALAWLPQPLRFVLVTSRRTRRWIFPKGGIEDGLDGPATAVREAWEEAGVIGPAESSSIGSYRSRKVRPPRAWALEIDVFPVAVREIRDHWPESSERARRFVTVEEARTLLRDPEMLRIAERFARR
ncbi:MAG TPA: NUDIX hydrolase [Paracoccaceae bacterium]|nr:NUDIX hydrolase [Paracoccaceae bacterium]